MTGAEIAGAIVAALTPIGGGFAFIWNKIEKRFTEIETQLAECHGREKAGLERRATQLTAIELMWQEIERLAPGSAVLTRVKKLLDDLKDQAREARENLTD